MVKEGEMGYLLASHTYIVPNVSSESLIKKIKNGKTDELEGMLVEHITMEFRLFELTKTTLGIPISCNI